MAISIGEPFLSGHQTGLSHSQSPAPHSSAWVRAGAVWWRGCIQLGAHGPSPTDFVERCLNPANCCRLVAATLHSRSRLIGLPHAGMLRTGLRPVNPAMPIFRTSPGPAVAVAAAVVPPTHDRADQDRRDGRTAGRSRAPKREETVSA